MGNAEIGLIGLGTMGSNLALNIAENGHRIAVYNRTTARTRDFAANAGPLKDMIVAVRHDRGAGRGHQAAASGDHHDGGRQARR